MEMPRITVVTPSFNQAAFLEQTIRSVFEQRYCNLQYGIVDGGSTDGSIEIIDKYRDRLDFAIVEPDGGQCEAINKGLARAEGEIVCYLNSDDMLLPDALRCVGSHFARQPQDNWVIGCCVETDAEGEPTRCLQPTGRFTLEGALLRDEPFNVPQPATFWRRRVLDEVGLFDESLHYCMDFEMWCRFLDAGHTPRLMRRTLATYRLHEASKTCSQADGFHAALIEIERRYLHRLPWRQRAKLAKAIGYQTRARAVKQSRAALAADVLRRPWWLASQQVRRRLWGGDATRAA